MEPNQVQPTIYYCRKCDRAWTTTESECRQCGRPMQTQSSVKSLGQVLIVLGVIIVIGGGIGLLTAAPVLLLAKLSEKEMMTALTALDMCGAVTAAGLTAIFTGRWQAKYGRSNRTLVWIFLGLIGCILVLGRFFSAFKG